MDFTLSETQQAVADLAAQIFGGSVSDERVVEIEATDDRFDRQLWSELAQANLLTLCLPEDAGGSGLGMVELCLILEQQGRRLAQVPLLWTAVATMTIAEFSAAVPDPDAVVTLALSEPGVGDPMAPTATVAGSVLTGRKVSVPWAHVASSMVVSASSADGPVLALAAPSGPGISLDLAEATNHEVVAHVTFDHAPVKVIDDPRAVRFAIERATVGLCALQVGVASEALARAAEYTSNRLQFGKPLSSFQSTSARAADAYIDTEAMQATMWQAAWRLDSGLDASVEIDVAKWWASEAGQRVVHATQHLHGGIGADISYPIHRYFLWGKQIEDTLGGGSAHLARIGKALAAR